MYCIYSTQSRCRAQNPACRTQIVYTYIYTLKTGIHIILRALILFFMYTLASTHPAAAPRPRLPASEPRCRADLT